MDINISMNVILEWGNFAYYMIEWYINEIKWISESLIIEGGASILMQSCHFIEMVY